MRLGLGEGGGEEGGGEAWAEDAYPEEGVKFRKTVRSVCHALRLAHSAVKPLFRLTATEAKNL